MADESLRAALDEARRLLRPPARSREPVWPTLAAAGFFAASALVFAAAAILAPPVQSPAPPPAVLRGVN